MNDPRQIWQNQRREHESMSVEEVRLRAFALQSRIHRNLIVTIPVGFLVLVFAAIVMTRVPYTSPRVIAAVLMILIVITIHRAYRAFWSPDKLPDDATPGACLEFYRRELTAQYNAVALTWGRLLVELALISVMVRFSMLATFRVGTVRMLLPVFLALIVFGRHWRARQLKKELDKLTAFEKEEE